jgi:hypothetical protein
VLERVVDELGEELAASDVPGFTLVAIREGAFYRRFLPAVREEHMVVGRHSEADLCIDGDPTVSLRHLIVRAVRLEDGTPALRILDLETPLGFGIEGDTPVRSIVATGPFAVALGEWTLCGIPHGQPPPRPVGDGPYRFPAPEVHLSYRVPRRVVGDARRSHITLLPRATDLVPATSTTASVTLTVSRRGSSVEVGVTADALEHGILIGRYGRCITGGLGQIVTDAVSRAHALILRTDGEDHIYDLASTQGTYLGGRRVRSALLPRTGANLRLGVTNPVEMSWSPRFDA